MRNAMSVMSVLSKKSRVAKTSGRSLRIERLEERLPMAGGGVTTDELLAQIAQLQAQLAAMGASNGQYPSIPPAMEASLEVRNLAMPKRSILPNDPEVVLGRFTIVVCNGRNYAQINNQTEFVFIPGFGEGLAGNLQNLTLRVDANGIAADGCEKVIGSDYPKWENDMVIIKPWQNIWVRNKPLKAEIVGSFSSCLSGDSISVELAGIFGLRDLGGKEIPADKIKYTGVDPVVHKMLDHTLGIYQLEGKPFSSVSPQESWKLIEFDVWGRSGGLQQISFSVTNPGNLVTTAFTMVQDTNDDGNGEHFWQGTFTPGPDATKGTVSFYLGNLAKEGGRFWVSGYTNGTAAVDNTFQMNIIPESVKGVDLETRVPLKEIMVNGNGAGQIQEWLSRSTTFALVVNPVLVVTGGKTVDWETPVQPVPVEAGAGVSVASFDANNISSSACTFQAIELSAKQGDVRNCVAYALWQVNADHSWTKLADGEVIEVFRQPSAVQFSFSSVVPAHTSVHYEVTATATIGPWWPPMLQAYVDPTKVEAKDSQGRTLGIDKVFYWLGENPWYTFEIWGDGGPG